MGTHIRVTDDLHEWLQEHRPEGAAYEDVIRQEVDGLEDRRERFQQA